MPWHALAAGPLSPPACLSLKSWPERSDPVHLIASGRVFARLARSPGSREAKPCMDAPLFLSYKVYRGDMLLQSTRAMYLLLSAATQRTSHLGLFHFTHRRDWQGFAIEDRCCCVVSRSRPLTACQGPKQHLLHLHGYSIQVHNVPATCPSVLSALSAMQTPSSQPVSQSVRGMPSSVRLTPRARRDQISGLLRALGRDLHVYMPYSIAASSTFTDRVVFFLPVCLTIPA